jgi:hypothetical protein
MAANPNAALMIIERIVHSFAMVQQRSGSNERLPPPAASSGLRDNRLGGGTVVEVERSGSLSENPAKTPYELQNQFLLLPC